MEVRMKVERKKITTGFLLLFFVAAGSGSEKGKN